MDVGAMLLSRRTDLMNLTIKALTPELAQDYLKTPRRKDSRLLKLIQRINIRIARWHSPDRCVYTRRLDLENIAVMAPRLL